MKLNQALRRVFDERAFRPIDPKLRAEFAELRALPAKELAREVIVRNTDSVLREPRRVPTLPSNALAFINAVAERAHGRRGLDPDRNAKHQWELWYGRIAAALGPDGISLAEGLVELRDWDRYEKLSARLEALCRALLALRLPWWPMHRLDERGNTLSIAEWASREIGRLNTIQVQQG